MGEITVIISDPAMKAFLDQVVSTGRYPSASDYVLELIRNDQQRRARLEALLIEGLRCGESIVMTDQVWEAMERDFDARHPEPRNC